MANEYRVAESTNVIGARIFSLQSTKDIQNGALVGKGDLVTGEKEVYSAIDDITNGAYLVLNPAWSYTNNSATDQNEENYINKAGIAFRAYRLDKDMKFKIANVSEKFNKGDFVKYNATDDKFEVDASGDTYKVVDVEEIGFPYVVGSYGVKQGDSGYVVNTKTTKYTIEVVK